MKICNCGYQNDDTDNFCKECGSPLPVQQQTPPPPVANQQVTPPPMTTGYYQPTTNVPQTTNPFPVLTALKSKGGSAAFLVATILFTVALVLTIVSSFSISEELYDAINTIGAYASMGDGEMMDMTESYNMIHQITPLLLVVSVISSIPTIIICIGLWCIYGTCKKPGSQPLKIGGFTAIKVIMILKMIGSCIAYALLLFTFVFLFLAAAAEGITMTDLMYLVEAAGDMGYAEPDLLAGAASALVGALVLVIVIFIISMILSIVYLVKIIGSLNCAKEIIVTGKTSKTVSAFVGVFMMIGGILNALIGLFGLDIATVLLGISSIIFASLLFSLRGAITRER